MAKNWTIKELAVAINENDFTGLQDVGRRFPIALAVMVKAASGDKEAFNTLMGAIPEHITVRKINSSLADGVEESDDEDGEETEDNAEVEEKKPVKKGTAKKKEAEPKPEKKAKKVKPAKPVKEETEEEEESDDEDGDTKDYGSMTARELFELCNSRGLKAEPKKPASHYIAILEAADNGGNSGDEDDDWDI